MTDPGLDLLTDPARLSALVGRSVRATHLRPKQGVSHTAALVGPGGAVTGWVQSLTGEARVKVAKTLDRAQLVGRVAEVGQVDLDGDTLLVWGPVLTDPRLAGPVHRIGLQGTVQVLRYNPLRRLVLRHREHVLRITQDEHRDRLCALATGLAELGVPVVPPAAPARAGLGASRHVSVWPWVEGHDAAHDAAPATAVQVGQVLGELHRAPRRAGAGLPVRGWAQLRAAATAAVEQLQTVAPAHAGPALQALADLPGAQEGGPRDPGVVVSHGDFSLDQCLVGTDGRVLLTDLDRAALAPPALDLATVEAVTRLDGHRGPGELAALHQGYARAAGRTVEVPPPWVAAAVLARVSEPWRSQAPGWPGATRLRSRLAQGLLSGQVPGGQGR